MHAFDIKLTQAPMMALHFKLADPQAIEATLAHKLADNPGFFDGEAVLIDLNALAADAGPVDLPALCALLRRHRMNPVALRSLDPSHLAHAELSGLFVAEQPAKPQPQAQAPAAAPAPEAIPTAQPAMVVDRPLRSGQQVYARGRDLVVLAMVNPGAEVMADGHIHVYAPLRGKAIAGAKGDTSARIFTTSLEAELVAIAGVYRTSDTPLPPDVQGRPAHVRLEDDRLVMAPM
jgi:septum site-determining protein MinC